MMTHKLVLPLLVFSQVFMSCSYDQPEFNPQRIAALEVELGEPEIEEEVVDKTPDVDLSQWNLIWSEEFDGPDSELEKRWVVQNSDVNPVIACGRWRENCLISDGTLKLMNKGPKEGFPSPYTSGNVWTKEQFQYGYFECRYKYAAAHATNNSFWIMATSGAPRFEIDINEGHFPNEVATNTINHSANPKVTTPLDQYMGVKNAYSFKMKVPVVTNKIRFSSVNHGAKFHIPEFRMYNVNKAGYPDPMSETADQDVAGLINYAKSATITSSGSYTGNPHAALADGKTTSHWVTQEEGDKWVVFEWSTYKKIGCIQFLNGWISGGNWIDILPDYKIEYYTGTEWKVLKSFDAVEEMNLAKEFHVYGLEWNKKELIYYFDRKEIRRIPNLMCNGPAPVWLSEAILPWKNPVPEEIIGTQMEVDYVRIYAEK